MESKLFPKNFLTIQVPPTIHVKERRDGALIIRPPAQGAQPSTMSTADTVAGTVTTSDTETHNGTSTNGETWTRTQKIATVLKSGEKGFPVIAAGFANAQPKSYSSEPDLSKDSFQITKPIPQADRRSDDDVHLVGEPRLADFTVKNVVIPPLDEAKPSFIFPDVSAPWEGSIATSFDRDEDDEEDSDDTEDSDDDNDSDDGSDQAGSNDTTDFPGGFAEVMKHVQVTPPFAPKGTKGKLRRR